MGLDYRKAGVDVAAANALVERIKPIAARTKTPEVVGQVGGFAGLCAIPADLQEPLLVSGTDGVGTKLRVAFEMDRHDTVGIDLVAMCVNDIVTCGARPLFFLDYYGTGQLDVDRAESVVRGIARGCEISGCALIGGETAELPGFYPRGEYELAGFAVGVVERAKLLDGQDIQPGDYLVGLGSTGLHANGYSLARKALLESAGLRLDSHVDDLEETVGEALLRPTRIYARAVAAATKRGVAKAFCHVTGGGLPENLPRILPETVSAEIDDRDVEPAAIFGVVQQAGLIELDEMRRTFNLGVGMIAVVAGEKLDEARAVFSETENQVWTIGRIIERERAGSHSRVRYAQS